MPTCEQTIVTWHFFSLPVFGVIIFGGLSVLGIEMGGLVFNTAVA